MGRARERADRIREQVPLDRVLEELGYAVMPDADREQQFPCDLHGDGSDGKPSARFYPESNSWYCFACGRARDVIATVMEKQGLSFSDACKSLENRYGLPPLPWKDDKPAKAEPAKILEEPASANDQVEGISHTTRRLIDSFTRDGTYDLDTSLRLWEAFDRVTYLHDKALISDSKAMECLDRVLQKAKHAIGQ